MIEIMQEYERVLKNDISFEGGKVLEAYYHENMNEIWFILDNTDYAASKAFIQKGLELWDSFGGLIIPIVLNEAQFSQICKPKKLIKLYKHASLN